MQSFYFKVHLLLQIVMLRKTRKIFAAILLVLLIGVPFLDWKLGAVLWMCAWLVFIFQNLFPPHNLRPGSENNEEDEPE